MKKWIPLAEGGRVWTAAAALVALGAVASEVAAAGRPPNVVLILADDFGWNQVSYHRTGSFYETPHIDRIAREGIWFSQAYSSASICSPTRGALMTGKYPARLGLHVHISPTRTILPDTPLVEAPQEPCLPLEETTIAEMLKAGGYRTAHFGKWHLSTDKNYAPGRVFDPGSQGFDETLPTDKPEDDADGSKDAHQAQRLTREAVAYLERQQGSEQPFFLYLAHSLVHDPLLEHPDWIRRWAGKPGAGKPENPPTMGAMVERLDWSVGEVLAALDRLGLSANTLVIFHSDNGGLEQEQSQAPLRAGKATLFEGGIRVPLAMRWPGQIPAGRTSAEPVISHDLFGTMLDAAGVPWRKDLQDGVSLAALARGQTESLGRKALFWHQPAYHHLGKGPASAVRRGQFKLIEWIEPAMLGRPGAYGLYDLAADSGEARNLAEEMPALTAELAAELRAWKLQVGAREMRRR